MSGGGRLRVLAVTSLFPNAASPHASAFNRQQLSELAELCELEVWAPIPWFPYSERVAPTSAAALGRNVPSRERIGSVLVEHPRTLHLPVVGRVISGPLYAGSIARRLWRRRRDFDVVLATWAYPDGWAVTLLGLGLSTPVVVKVHGSDINVVAQKAVQRAQLRMVLPHAAGVIAVSQPLALRVAELGVSPERLHRVPNGVDSGRFHPRDPTRARAALSVPAEANVVVYIGNLKRDKGVLDLIEAWPKVARERAGARLYIVGGGPEERAVNDAAAQTGSITAVGAVSHAEVAQWMAACDLLCLPSWDEGTPNVVLEAHASGRPVVASHVGGIPDLISSPVLGRLVPPREPARLAEALVSSLESSGSPDEIAAAAQTISWTESARRVHRVLQSAASRLSATNSGQ